MEEQNNEIKAWTPNDMLEVTLSEPDDFLKIRETLTRIGVASRKDNKLFQSCHILHKQGRYFIVHFKELFALDGKSIPQLVLILADYQYKNSFVADHELNLVACLTEIMANTEFK